MKLVLAIFLFGFLTSSFFLKKSKRANSLKEEIIFETIGGGIILIGMIFEIIFILSMISV